ncbi:hypothetical protein EDB81DRAFT_767475 [Dactylonectria macrodidyma]|uniref:Uncharacterized protein n=1 Tax=Dactylonectria macrodidyma TaxID=307937 RepID=A0A9P9DCT3_9HYPO|nr:hypothetical protein EDB81DRAFT_767475 [Dactylonectria macrodidyma]
MENKLHEDADALGSSMSQFKYVYSRLSGRAKEDVTTFVEIEVTSKERKESFAAFYPRFEREIANANAEAWPDDSKISYLRNALNDKLKLMLVPVNRAEINSYIGLATNRLSHSGGSDARAVRVDLLLTTTARAAGEGALDWLLLLLDFFH